MSPSSLRPRDSRKTDYGNFDLANLWADPKSSDSSCKNGLRLATDLRHHAAGLSTTRYRVDRAMPKRAAISATGISAVLSRARMVLISLGESFAGRPPLRPRARADLRPATVLSRIKLRSNSARAAKTWNTRRPAGERVSIFSVRDSKLILRCSSSAISLRGCLKSPFEIGYVRLHVIERGSGKSLRYRFER